MESKTCGECSHAKARTVSLGDYESDGTYTGEYCVLDKWQAWLYGDEEACEDFQPKEPSHDAK